MSDALLLLLRINLAVAAAVAVVMLLRLPVRRLFGARIAYRLWSLAALAAAAMLLPVRVVTVAQAPSSGMLPDAFVSGPVAPALRLQPGHDLAPILAGLWIAGALASLGWLVWRQAQFGRALREGRAGPAVIGVLKPRIVTPADFTARYTPREQLVVLAHEQTHIARHDSRINAAVALVRCASWFNPLIHVLAQTLRIDQELACDAQVVAAHPNARRSYAEAMLKTQLAARPLPIGCYWPAQAAHPLAERIGLLRRKTPSRARRRAGAAAVALLGLGVAWSAWAARPAETVLAPGPVREPPALPGRTAPAAAPTPSGPAGRATARTLQLRTHTPADPAADASAPPADAETQPFPDHKVYGVASRSSVEPGSAVRLLATMTDRDGVPLTTDLTAFGSQSAYRFGYYWKKGSRYSLFTSVVQQDNRFAVTASLDRRFSPDLSGSIVLAAGQTGRIVLADGQVVTVTPWVRPETRWEVEEGRRATGSFAFHSPRFTPASWRPDLSRCGGSREIC
jgi:beta-lactamase regulating signal transducer with metallopeptidase domain